MTHNKFNVLFQWTLTMFATKVHLLRRPHKPNIHSNSSVIWVVNQRSAMVVQLKCGLPPKKFTLLKWIFYQNKMSTLASYTSYSAAAGGVWFGLITDDCSKPCDVVTGAGVKINTKRRRRKKTHWTWYFLLSTVNIKNSLLYITIVSRSSQIRCKQYQLFN